MSEIIFHPLARREADGAADFHEDARPGFGFLFLTELQKALSLMVRYPRGWPFFSSSSRVRRIRLNRFSYLLLYAITENGFYIVAVMHQSRHPEYWKNRETEIPD